MSKFLILVVGLGDGTASSGFRFRAMTDKDMDGTNVPVFDVMYDNATLFKVDPTNGKIYFGTNFWYDPADGAIRTPNDKTVIKADGTIEAVDGHFSGDIYASSGYFKGVFDTTALKLVPSGSVAHTATYGGSDMQAKSFCDYFLSEGLISNAIYKAHIPSGTYYWRYSDYFTFEFQGDDIKYIQFSRGTKDSYVYLYKSNMRMIEINSNIRIYLRTRMPNGGNNNYYTTNSLPITLYTGGDILQVSSDMPQTSDPSSLDDYQLYVDPSTGNMKVKLP